MIKIKSFLIILFSLLIAELVYPQKTIDGSFTFGGLLRTYRIYIPAVYKPSKAAPLLFNIHGYGSNNIEQEAYGDFRPIADTAGFIIVHPNGTMDFQNTLSWNTFGVSTVDDVGFISALIDTLKAGYNIDLNRVYSTGMSNGGFMSYELACKLSARIAAIASVTGSMTNGNLSACNAKHPTPVLEIHGTADGTVPYTGNLLFVPIPTLVDYWAKFNNCLITPVITKIPDINVQDGCSAERYLYSGGNSGSRVELLKIIGGGHTWPGSMYNIGVTNMDFSASIEIWRFLSRFKLNGLVSSGIDDELLSKSRFKVYPNPSQDIFTIEFADQSQKTVIVTNYLGQTIRRFTCNCASVNLNIEKQGVYLVSVRTGNKTITQRVIKQ